MLKFDRLRIILFSILFFSLVRTQAQYKGQADIYEIYKEQLASLLETRGLPEDEIIAMLDVMKKNQIDSDESLARLLGKLYSAERGIGILFYFFKEDSLRRVFFEPGKIKEVKTIKIKKQDLLQVNTDIYHAIGLYQASGNRAPKKRGVTPKTPLRPEGLTYESVVKKATQLLLPKDLDTSYKHLLIIPALNIGTFPFHLLQPYGDSTALIEHCSFTVIPGLVDLFSLRLKVLSELTKKEGRAMNGTLENSFDDNFSLRRIDKTKFTLENPLFISNPVYPRDAGYDFPDLPGAKKEITNALRYAENYHLFEGEKAIRDSVIRYIWNSDLVYFATHGIADEEKPMEKSFLVLSGKDPFLTAKDIMELRKKRQFGQRFPEMAILSACQTGLGKSMEAGIAGLARSFLLGGTNHVVMSLWNVSDEATAFLMGRFIHYLQYESRFTPSGPLRRAILDTKKKYPNPLYWASFSIFGIDY